MLHALNDSAVQVTTGTTKTSTAQQHFLDCCATNPNAEILFCASDMTLKGDCDAAHTVASCARSRAAGYIHFGNHEDNNQIMNAPILVLATILKMVVASAAEAEIAALFHNA